MRAPVMTLEEYREWRGQRPMKEVATLVAETGIAPVRILGEKAFMWTCPGCGGTAFGDFGEGPISGWEAPRWTRAGDDEHLTLTPSLGCRGWLDGTCPGGHYWLRDGELVPA